jgi:hypothetical protein
MKCAFLNLVVYLELFTFYLFNDGNNENMTKRKGVLFGICCLFFLNKIICTLEWTEVFKQFTFIIYGTRIPPK